MCLLSFKKPPFWATLITIIGLIVLCGLGTWQVQRLAWKQDLIAKINGQTADDRFFDAKNIAESLNSAENIIFLRGQITGQFTGATRHLEPRTYDGKSGKHIIAPFVLDNGTTILVNAGWVPFSNEGDIEFPTHTITLKGVLKRPDKASFLTPPNDNDQGIWYAINFDDAATSFGFEPQSLLKGLFYNETTLPMTQNYPLPHVTNWQPRNNHLSYAIFWFLMAAAMAAVFFLRFIYKARD